MKILNLVFVSFLFASAAQAAPANCARYARLAPRGETWKECKQARRNADADAFLLTQSGDLYAFFEELGRGGRACQMAEHVTDFKASAHPNDRAIIYFESGNNLWAAANTRVRNNCPQTKKNILMRNVKKWTVVSNTRTEIVNAALSRSGEFMAFDNDRAIFTKYNVADYQMNKMYGDRPFYVGRSRENYADYVAYTLGMDGRIAKIEGRGFFDRFELGTNGRYSSIQQFKASHHLP